MSKLQVTLEIVSEVKPHPNADRLELATVLGWQCVVSKGSLKQGDMVVYFPIDSVLPDTLVNRIFADSKIKPKDGRIKTIKIRGAISQGLAIPARTLIQEYYTLVEGGDVTGFLKVTKYEAPQTLSPRANVRIVSERESNPHFFRYTDIDHLKKFPKALEGKRVIVTEKIHGTNFRAGWVPRANTSWWQKILMKIGVISDQEFVYGSHNVQLQDKTGHDYYSSRDKGDVYSEAVSALELKKSLPRNTVVYMEIYGDGIQKNYTYGCEKGERGAVLLDAKVNGKFLDWVDLEKLAFMIDVQLAPLLWVGDFSMEEMEYHVEGPSTAGDQPIREGIVVRTITEETGYNGRQIFKLLNPEYLLLKDNTENH